MKIGLKILFAWPPLFCAQIPDLVLEWPLSVRTKVGFGMLNGGQSEQDNIQ